MRDCAFRSLAAPACAVLLALAMISPAAAAPYTVAYSGGSTWNDIYAQGFSTSLGAIPAPGLANGAAVYLNQFQFFKSESTDNTSNFQLEELKLVQINRGAVAAKPGMEWPPKLVLNP